MQVRACLTERCGALLPKHLAESNTSGRGEGRTSTTCLTLGFTDQSDLLLVWCQCGELRHYLPSQPGWGHDQDHRLPDRHQQGQHRPPPARHAKSHRSRAVCANSSTLL